MNARRRLLQPAAALLAALPRDRVLVPLLLAVTAVAQWPALRSGFQHDDFLHLYAGVQLPFLDLLAQQHSGHVLISFRLFLRILYGAFGMHALPYLAVGLLLHLVNAALLYLVVRRLSGRELPAFAFAALWGMSPIAQGSLGWLSVYGHVLATTAILAVLLGAAGLAERGERPTPLALIGWCALLLVAASSFGTGLAVAAVFPLALWLLLPEAPGNRQAALRLAPLSIAVAFLYSRFAPERPYPWPASFLLLAFAARLSHLLSYGVASLLLAPLFTVAGDRTAAWGGLGYARAVALSYAVSVPAALFVGGVALRCDRAARRQIAALALLAVAAYAAIAIGRVTYPIVPAAQLAIEARYHYLAPALLAAAFALAAARARIRVPSGIRAGAVALAVGLLLVLAPGIASRIGDGSAAAARGQIEQAVARLEGVVEPLPEGSDVYLRNSDFDPMRLSLAMGMPRSMFPGLAAFFAIAYREGALEGHRVYFVERDRAIVEQVRTRPDSPMARLLVTPEEARAAGAAVLDASERAASRVERKPALERPPRDPEARAKLRQELKEKRQRERREARRARPEAATPP